MAEQGEQGGISRRSLLTKGAVAGGVVWVAPVVLSAPAGAQEVSGPPGGCQNIVTVYAKWDNVPSSGCVVGAAAGGNWAVNEGGDPCVECTPSALTAAQLGCVIASLPTPTATVCKDSGEYLGLFFDFTPTPVAGVADVIAVLDGEISAGSQCTTNHEPDDLTVEVENTEILNRPGTSLLGISHVDFCLTVCIDDCLNTVP